MKITVALIEKLIRLCDGDSLPASQLRGEWVEDLIRDGVLISTSHGSRRTLYAPQSETLCKALSVIDERLRDLEQMKDTLLSNDLSRSDQASATGNSKLVDVRSCPGFPINSYEPITCTLNGQEFMVNPQEGSFLFIADWQTFYIPSDVVVVGVENMENFRKVRQQCQLFMEAVGSTRLLFVSRYPQSKDLVSWLQKIPNRYVHFGDFDLAGINIFLTEFYAHLGARSSFLIPHDIEARLRNGSKERYDAQYQRFRNLRTDMQPLQALIDFINKFHRGYDQEGYINKLSRSKKVSLSVLP